MIFPLSKCLFFFLYAIKTAYYGASQMIVGTGIDVVDIDRIKNICGKYGPRFMEKYFTKAELEGIPSNQSPYLAGRFAAKEAAVKALGCGFTHGITPCQIETLNDHSGKPQLQLHNTALRYAVQLGANNFHISISHERKIAVALVILEAR